MSGETPATPATVIAHAPGQLSPDDLPAPGLHVRLDGSEYRVISRGRWALWSDHPAPGFRRINGRFRSFLRPIKPGEPLESHRIVHRGTYRGIPVALAGSTEGLVMATTKDSRAIDAGFDVVDRTEWVALFPSTTGVALHDCQDSGTGAVDDA